MKSIRLCYRKVIDSESRQAWDRAVFDATHLEFYMQAQRLDPKGKYKTFVELIEEILDAQHLHYLASSAAMGYIRLLGDIIPDITDRLGQLCLPFNDFKFKIIQSHLEQKSQHSVAISFFSKPLLWLDTVGDSLLIARSDMSESFRSGLEIETNMIDMAPNLSISYIIQV
jgi:hypothetical protein